jgi:integrase
MKLTDKKIAQAKPREKEYPLADGHGLVLIVKPNGGKYWVHRFYFENKRIPMNLGVYPFVSLKESRQIHLNNRLLVSKGINPKELKDNEKNARKKELLNTFESIAEKFFEDKFKPSTSPSTWKKIIPYFQKDIYPKIGMMPVNDIKGVNIIDACKKIADRGSRESAVRVCRKISEILSYATMLGLANGNVANGLSKTLPKPIKGNFNATTNPRDFGEILRKIDSYQGFNPIIKACLQIMPYVFTRQGELRSMRWDELDLIKGVWIYQVSKTKTNHGVPLAKQVIELIQKLVPLTGATEYVFISDRGRGNEFISDSALRNYLRKAGVSQEQTSLHGFRTSARTIADEVLEVNTDMLEIQLSHKNPKDKHGGAYARAEFMQQRKDFMQQWANYCDGLKNEKQ